METKKVYEEWGGKKFIRVSKKRYWNFIRFFEGQIEGNFFMDWVDNYDWSLRSGKYEIGTWENADECMVSRHYVAYDPKDEEYYISVDYIELKKYDLNTVVPKKKEHKKRLTKKEKMYAEAICKFINKAFETHAKQEALENEIKKVC